jgi:sulfatase modifying factor 1
MGSSAVEPLVGGVALPGRVFGDFDERPPRHNVSIDSFYVGVTEVTNLQYEEFDPSHRLLRGFEHGYSTGDDEAVVFVSHANASAYCAWLSGQPAGSGAPARRYRLPTEEEWEYAARGGTSTNFWWGDPFDSTKAQLPGSSCPQACPNLTVGRYPPNPFALFDTAGNVEEWTSSAYSAYPGADVGGFSPGLFVTRGGSHSNEPSAGFYLRAANRGAALPTERSSVIGFRVAASASAAAGAPKPTSMATADVVAPPRPALVVARTATTRLPPPPPMGASTADRPAVFHGPFEYTRFSSQITEDSGGPLFLQHNHAPAMGILPGGKTMILSWFSTVTVSACHSLALSVARFRRGGSPYPLNCLPVSRHEFHMILWQETGREPVYAYSTMDVSTMSSGGGFGGSWKNASLFWKAADRGQQTQAFHTSQDGRLSWYACVAPAAGYISASIYRRDMNSVTGKWGAATIVTTTADSAHAPKQGSNMTVERVPLHANGHIPFERIVELPPLAQAANASTTTTTTLAMPATYMGVSDRCVGCAKKSASSIVLVSTDKGHSWAPAGPAAFMSGISQFVALKNGSLLALGRGGSNVPTPDCPWLTRSVSHDRGKHWQYGWYAGLWPLGTSHRMVFFRLHEGPLLLISFTGGSNVTTISGKTRRISGLYAALSTDEGNSFQIKKPLVDERALPSRLPTEDNASWTMTNSTAEPKGYTTARQTPDGMIHVASSRLSYHFNLAWLDTPPPDAPNAPLPAPPAPSHHHTRGPPIPSGVWETPAQDWKMHSPTAHRTITAVHNTTLHRATGGGQTMVVKTGWAYVLVAPPVLTGKTHATWKVQCPCSPY